MNREELFKKEFVYPKLEENHHHPCQFDSMDLLDAIRWADEHPKSPWIKCSERMPVTKSYKPTTTEHQVSEYVLTWDTFYGCEKNRLWDGEWETELEEKRTISPAVCHQIIAWMPIPEYDENNIYSKVNGEVLKNMDRITIDPITGDLNTGTNKLDGGVDYIIPNEEEEEE